MPVIIHRLCSTAPARADDLKRRCFDQLPDQDTNTGVYQFDTVDEEEAHKAKSKLPAHGAEEEDTELLGEEAAGTKRWMTDRIHSEILPAALDMKEMAVGFNEELVKAGKDPEALPGSFKTILDTFLGLNWRERYQEIKESTRHLVQVVDDIRDHEYRYNDDLIHSSNDSLFASEEEPEEGTERLRLTSDYLLQEDADTTRFEGLQELADSEPNTVLFICAKEDNNIDLAGYDDPNSCVAWLYPHLFKKTRYPTRLRDINVEEGTEVNDFLGTLASVMLHETTHYKHSIDTVDVILKEDDVPEGFNKRRAGREEEIGGWRCYYRYLCRALALSKSSQRTLENAESWTLIMLLWWLTKNYPDFEWITGRARRRETTAGEPASADEDKAEKKTEVERKTADVLPKK